MGLSTLPHDGAHTKAAEFTLNNWHKDIDTHTRTHTYTHACRDACRQAYPATLQDIVCALITHTCTPIQIRCHYYYENCTCHGFVFD